MVTSDVMLRREGVRRVRRTNALHQQQGLRAERGGR